MGTGGNQGGQGGKRKSTNAGEKKRSPTSTPHKGSRVEPSHVNDKARHNQEMKDARKAIKPARKTAK